MLVAFAGTTLTMLLVLPTAARYLDGRPIRAYGYHFSKDWWLDFVVGTGVGTLIVAMTFSIARYTDSLQVTSSTGIPSTASLGWLLAFLVAFLGVTFYEEYIYRGSFITNAVEGLSSRGVDQSVATTVALFASTLGFAVIHLPSAIASDANIGLVVLKTGLLGGLFGVAYFLTDELALPMGLHLGVNYALMNVFGVGAAGIPSIPSLVTVEVTATGLWSPSRGIPLFVATLTGYVFVAAWTRWRQYNHPSKRETPRSLTNSD